MRQEGAASTVLLTSPHVLPPPLLLATRTLFPIELVLATVSGVVTDYVITTRNLLPSTPLIPYWAIMPVYFGTSKNCV